MTIEKEVRSVVEGFVKNGEMFTALDVSNKVKLALPFARHSEVRDIVRDLFTNELQNDGWARSPIQVTLPNGTQQTALLYHLLSDSWDLDTKYDTQKRQQAALRPGVNHSAAPASTPAPVAAPVAVATPSPLPTRDQWDAMFKSQPSLFPRR